MNSCGKRHPGWNDCEESVLLGSHQGGPTTGTTTIGVISQTTTTTTVAPTTTTTTSPATTTTTTVSGCPDCIDIIYEFE